MAAQPSVEKLTRTAVQAAKQGDWLAACSAYAEIIADFPKNQRARRGLANIRPTALPALLERARQALKSGAASEAEELLQAAHLLAPEMAEVALALAACQLETGRAPAALDTMDSLLARQPQLVAALNHKGRAEREMGRIAASEATLEAALAVAPGDAQTLNNLATTARSAGQMEKALDYYRKALRAAPQSYAVHYNYAQVHRYAPGDAHMEELTALAGKAGDDPAAKALHFTLFKALNDLEEREAAFAHLTRANALARAAGPYDFKRDAIPFALTKAIFAAPMAVAAGPATPRPIFVTGLPRTGTSLVERMLARTPQVQPCGELPVVQLAVGRVLREVTGRADKTLRQDDIVALRDELLAGLARYADGRPVMVDKMPLNFRWIGFILAALPEAKVVHLSRDPMAVAWSLYRLDFGDGGLGFIYDPEDIARFMVLHREYMALWAKVCPGQVHRMQYEALVEDPEAQGKALAEATGLTWSEDWLHPEKGQNPTMTASFHQVRRPIYRGSNAGWRDYEAQLAPMQKALARAGLLD